MHINALDRDAHLAGMIIAAFGDWLYDRVEIGAPINDDGCDPAMLERATGSRRQDRAQSPTDLRRSDEAQEGDACVGREGFCLDKVTSGHMRCNSRCPLWVKSR